MSLFSKFKPETVPPATVATPATRDTPATCTTPATPECVVSIEMMPSDMGDKAKTRSTSVPELKVYIQLNVNYLQIEVSMIV